MKFSSFKLVTRTGGGGGEGQAVGTRHYDTKCQIIAFKVVPPPTITFLQLVPKVITVLPHF